MKLLLFGAGASIPFFKTPLTTNYITQEISKVERWKPILKCYWEQSHTHFLSAHKISRIIKKIIKHHPDYNFEDICESFDKLTLYQWPSQFKLTIQDLRMCNVIRYYKKINIDTYLPFFYRCVLLSIILDSEKEHSNKYDELIELQRSFLEYYSCNEAKMSIVTLNYDDCLYTSVKEKFDTGFVENERIQNHYTFSPSLFFHSPKTISFLHGNIRFNSNHFTPTKIVNYQTRIETMTNNPSPCYNFHYTESYSFNTFLTTGKSKENSLNDNPYAMYYQKMASDILYSDEIIVIGYSFNDEHINRMLLNYWETNPTKRLIIVDFCGHSTDSNFFQNLSATIHKIKTFFSTIFNDDTYDIQHLKGYGYGCLFPKILLYAKGYEDFLREYEEVFSHFSDSIYIH